MMLTWQYLYFKRHLDPIYLDFIDKLGKRDVQDTSASSLSSTYPSISGASIESIEVEVLFFVSGCIDCSNQIPRGRVGRATRGWFFFYIGIIKEIFQNLNLKKPKTKTKKKPPKNLKGCNLCKHLCKKDFHIARSE